MRMGGIWKHVEASRGIWRHLESSGVIWRHLETSRRHLEASGGMWWHLGGIWRRLESSGRHLEASATPWRHSGRLSWALLGSLVAPGAWEASCTHKLIDVCSRLQYFEKVTISAESGEGDHHQVPRLSTKVGGRRPRADPPNISAALIKDNPPEPLQCEHCLGNIYSSNLQCINPPK